MAALGVFAVTAWTAEQGEAIGWRFPSFEQALPFDETPAQSPNALWHHGRVDELFSPFPPRTGPGAGTEDFLGFSWLKIPNSPLDDDVLVEHPIQKSGKRFTRSVALLQLGEEQPQATISSLDSIIDNDDLNAVVAVRFKF